MPLHNKLQLPLKKGQYRIGKQDLFAVVIALRYLIENGLKKMPSSYRRPVTKRIGLSKELGKNYTL